jgi:hypothetical protein
LRKQAAYQLTATPSRAAVVHPALLVAAHAVGVADVAVKRLELEGLGKNLKFLQKC